MGKRPRRTSQKEIAATAATVDETPYFFLSPESSTINSAGYDPRVERLTVVFRDGGTYVYDKVPRLIWLEWLEATSRGKFFAERIRPLFQGKKV